MARTEAMAATLSSVSAALCCLFCLFGGPAFVGCGGEEQAPIRSEGERAEGERAEGERGEGERAEGEGEARPTGPRDAHEEDALTAHLGRSRVQLDLLALAHLADVEQGGGLAIDFGTPARHKYTMGSWHSGFLSDGSQGERTFSRVAPNAKIYVHVDERGPLTLRLRARRAGAENMVVYFNGQTLGQVDFANDQSVTKSFAIAAEHVHPGENVVQLRPTGVAEDQVGAELEWAHLIRGEAVATGEADDRERPAPPRFASLRAEVALGGDRREALVLPGEGSLRWYVEVPPAGELFFRAGVEAAEGGSGTPRGHLVVSATPEGGERTTLAEIELGPRWQGQLLSLSSLANKVARLEFRVTGLQGRAAIAGPAIVVPQGEALAEAPRPRSVIVLLIDTLRASKLRAYDPRSRVRTPVLDRFAEQSTLFERAQAPENWTKPSVASILTSLTPATHGTKETGSQLPERFLTLGEVYRGAGYTTAMLSANGYVSDRFGFSQGWDHYTNYIREERNSDASVVFGEALEWIRRVRAENESRPFFLYLQTIDPHVPYDPPEEYLRMYDDQPYEGRIHNQRRTGISLEESKREEGYFTERDIERLRALHDGEISQHDHEMGRFIEALTEMGLYDQILFVVTSDHGEEFMEHGSLGHGHSVYQELLHVPLMFRWPGTAQARRVREVVSTMDIGPTILEASGVDIPEAFEGHSLMPFLRGRSRPGPSVAFSDKLDDRRVILAGSYKLVVRGNLSWAMFDLADDPGERRQIDSASRRPIALRYMRILLGQYLGAEDRGAWLYGGTGRQGRVLPERSSGVAFDPELCQQLHVLGYFPEECQPVN